MKFSSRWCWALTAAIPALLLVGLGLSRPQADATPAKALTNTEVVAAAPGWVDVQGGTRHLSMTADGVVASVSPISESRVPAGSVLLRLDDAALQLEQQATALDIQGRQHAERDLAEQSQQAQEEALRLQALVDMQAEPADVLRQAQAQVRSLHRALEGARLEIAAGRVRQQSLTVQREHHLLRAPSRGRVLRTDVHEGEAVSRGIPVVWFAPDAPMIVRAELDERLFTQVRVGMRAEVEAESGDGRVIPARLLSIAGHVGPIRALPELRALAQDDRVVECVLELGESRLLIGQRVIVRIRGLP